METLLVDRSAGVVTVTLNRPEKKNAANQAMWRELRQVFDDVAANADDRVMVVTGAGGAFCSGADLTDAPGRSAHPLHNMRTVNQAALALHRLPKPTIAKVGGVAAGAGCNLAFGCDLVVASEDARFSEIFARRGLSVDFGGTWLLPRLVGLHRAKELAFLADIISAKEAADIGVVNRVVPAPDLDRFVDDWAQRIAQGPPIALSLTKAMLNNSIGLSMDEALEVEAHAQCVNLTSADAGEAIAAFLEKRDPHFKGA